METLEKLIYDLYKKNARQCTDEEIYNALLIYTKNQLFERGYQDGKKKIYYISAEFLIGKLLSNNLINLGIYDDVAKFLKENGKEIAAIEEVEPEPSLGNGGLGRLAACFLDSIATLGLPGEGIGLNYHFGLFKQVFKNHKQYTEKNDWIEDDSWLTKTDVTFDVMFGEHKVTSRLYDIDVVGYENGINKLHLFDIETVDESIVKSGIDFDKKDIDKTAKSLYSRIESNKLLVDNISEKRDILKGFDDKYVWLKALSETANGDISGKEKITLETFVQMTYFDSIIRKANIRLLTMSDGQYELVRRSDAETLKKNEGLALDVIDHFNGSSRSVSTLSGGESFMASLCLALGLSDEIQSSNGGIKLDTMFVDEGFGSLDGEALDRALSALTSLSQGNRLVGIISHVDALCDRIDNKIVITKDRTFGSNAQIICD